MSKTLFSDLRCPESHPFASPPEDFFKNGEDHVSGLNCCVHETGENCKPLFRDSEGVKCLGVYLNFSSYTDHNTCKDHPSAVRTPGKFY